MTKNQQELTLIIYSSIIALYGYGVYLGFAANVLIGLAFIAIPPLGTVTGIAQFFFSYNIPEEIMRTIN